MAVVRTSHEKCHSGTTFNSGVEQSFRDLTGFNVVLWRLYLEYLS